MASVISRSIEVFISRALSDSARSKALADWAQEDVAALIMEGRAPPEFSLFVDGRKSNDPYSVKPDGVLNYKFNLMGYVVMLALAELQRMSPYGGPKPAANQSGAGHYRDKFYVGVNGRMIMANYLKPALIPADAEIVIGNVQPYSRKVDTRLVGFQQLHFANGEEWLFDKTVRTIRRRYGGVIEAKRVYTMKFSGQYVLMDGEKAGKPVESPSIIIKPKGMIT